MISAEIVWLFDLNQVLTGMGHLWQLSYYIRVTVKFRVRVRAIDIPAVVSGCCPMAWTGTAQNMPLVHSPSVSWGATEPSGASDGGR